MIDITRHDRDNYPLFCRNLELVMLQNFTIVEETRGQGKTANNLAIVTTKKGNITVNIFVIT